MAGILNSGWFDQTMKVRKLTLPTKSKSTSQGFLTEMGISREELDAEILWVESLVRNYFNDTEVKGASIT